MKRLFGTPLGAVIFAVAVALGFMAFVPPPPAYPAEPIPVTQMQDSAVALYERGEFTCSGVVVKTKPVTLVLTAAHCTGADSLRFEELGKRRGKVVPLGSYTVFVDVVAEDRHNDLALLMPRAPLPTIVKATTVRDPREQLQPGEFVYSVSSPAGLQNSLQVGIVANARQLDPRAGDEPFTQLNIPGAWFGSSGGGIYDAAGRLVSVYSRMIPGSTILIVPTPAALDFFLRTSPQFQVFGENRGGM